MIKTTVAMVVGSALDPTTIQSGNRMVSYEPFNCVTYRQPDGSPKYKYCTPNVINGEEYLFYSNHIMDSKKSRLTEQFLEYVKKQSKELLEKTRYEDALRLSQQCDAKAWFINLNNI